MKNPPTRLFDLDLQSLELLRLQIVQENSQFSPLKLSAENWSKRCINISRKNPRIEQAQSPKWSGAQKAHITRVYCCAHGLAISDVNRRAGCARWGCARYARVACRLRLARFVVQFLQLGLASNVRPFSTIYNFKNT